jgi:hypothetical protein
MPPWRMHIWYRTLPYLGWRPRIDIFYDEPSASDRVFGELHSVLRVHREALTRPLASTFLEESVHLEDLPRIDCYRRTDRIVAPSAQ